ncbi:MAG: Peptidase [Rhodocyclales bacterium]|nr:Peptidase [Rhodocyclales bacterium]
MNNCMTSSRSRTHPVHPHFACLSALAAALMLSACVSSRPAPVETRDTSPRSKSADTSTTSTPVAVARPGYYIVKKGDTLYSIALENGHAYREVAAWNGIDNPSMISVGQEIRIQPPDAPAAQPDISSGTRAVILPRIESRPIDQSAPAATSASSSSTVSAAGSMANNASSIVTEPRGGRIPYSDKAWKDLQALALTQSEPKAASAPLAEKPVEIKPGVKPVVPPAASAPVAVPDAAVKTGEDGVEWSWPSNGKLIGTFNDSSNKGVDIAGAIGDPVFAAAAGKVIYSGSDLRAYGNLVIIKHGTQFTTVYAHNKEILVKEGQTVQKGQKIAVMGDSDSDRPKLHFEVRKQGKPADPLKFLPTR